MIDSRSPLPFDTAVVGSGFAGSIIAMILRRAGQKVLLIEKGRHPRFAIGESSTPLANLLLEEIARDADLPNLHKMTEWGRWQKHLPELPCGLKRGFSFYKHEVGASLQPHDRSTQLLVAASPNDSLGDTHWYRPAVDEYLVNEAISHGVHYRSDTTITKIKYNNESWEMELESQNQNHQVQARFIVDASGPQGFMSQVLSIPPSQPANTQKTQALFAHFTKVPRLEDSDSTFDSSPPPYPVDDAAVHHIFEGGWIWVLRFNNGVTSVGVVMEDDAANSIGLKSREIGWQKLLNNYPSLKVLLGTAQRVTDWHYVPQVAWKVETVVGENWAMLPSAAGFIDPMLSTGFPLTLLGIQRLARILTETQTRELRQQSLKGYEAVTLLEIDQTADLIGALYSNLKNFENFCNLTLLYFAAASFAETVGRLGHPERAQGFLRSSDPQFGPKAREICRLARLEPRVDIRQRIVELIAPFDVAGLTNQRANNWFPVVIGDLVNNAEKTGSTREEVISMLQRSGVPI